MQVLHRLYGGQSVVLAMALASVLAMAGCSGSGSSASSENVTASPTMSPGAGTYNRSQTVTIADSTPGAVFYCTTDGTTPTVSSPQCSQPSTVFKTEFLQVIAVAPGKSPSTVASAGYTIDLSAVATPTFSPAGGSYSSAQTLTIKDATTGANIYYTTDGTVPTASSTLYTGAITVSSSETISAVAIASGYNNSGVASANYVIGAETATPVISRAGGMYSTAQSVTITDATSGASIYYTTDGSAPTSSSTPYSGAITVSTSETIKAIAIASGDSSSIATATYTINISATAAPTFTPGAGAYSSTQTVLLNAATSGATIFYTTDGSTPTASSTQYNGSGVTVATSETIKAIATSPGFAASAVASAAYTINASVAPPTFSPGAGSYTSTQAVTLNDVTPGAAIYYTTDGGTPTTSSTAYSSAIPVSASETLNAIAVAAGNISSVATAAYTISSGSSLSGKVMSGALPVNGASVRIYGAGQTGYASNATALLTSPATTGADGSFTLNYNCPAAPGDLVYIVASGGSTGSGGSNAGSVLMAALGSCAGTLPGSVVVNEVTTVASAYALSQFMTGAANVGAAATATSYQGLTNAFGTVSNLVNLSSGQALDHTPAYPTNLAGDPNILNNSTVPQSRINTLADALNACAADGTGCSTLFSAATPSSGPAPSDTLQAILNIAQNPGNNVGSIYNVTAGSGPFTPALSAAPNDWTLALTFTGGGLGFTPDFQIATTAFTDGKFLNTAMAIDATGNIWVTGSTMSRASSAPNIGSDSTSGMIAEFNNLGAPLTPASGVTSGSTPTAIYGGYIPINRGSGNDNAGTLISQSIAFDPSGNAWIIGGAAQAGGAPGSTLAGEALTEIKPDLSVVLPYLNLGASTDTSLAIDGLGNLWALTGQSAGNAITEFDSTGNMITSNTGLNEGGNQFGYFTTQSLIFDSNASALWGADSFALTLYQISPADGSNTVDYYPNLDGAGYTSLVAGSANPDGSAGNVYGCTDPGGQTLDVFNVSAASVLKSYPISTGRGCGTQMVMDGAGHIFTVTGGTMPGILDEFMVTSSGLSVISPSSGFTGTSGTEAPAINPDSAAPSLDLTGFASLPNGVKGAAIDGSGNLWVLNIDTGTSSSPGNALVEYVGIAAPVVTPTSLAIQFGQVGQRP